MSEKRAEQESDSAQEGDRRRLRNVVIVLAILEALALIPAVLYRLFH